MTIRSSIRAIPFLLLAACGDGGEQGGMNIFDNDPNPLPTPDASTMVDPNVFPVTRYSEITKPYEDTDVAGCSAWMAAPDADGGVPKPVKGRDCMCNKCLAAIQECDALQGCREIRECSQASGCDSEISCYLFPGAPCVDVIDKWGNASVSVTVSLEYIKCAKLNKCQ
jgi:hypothetical protein